MTSNAVATVPQNSLLPTMEVWNQIVQLGQAYFKSGLLPSSIKNPEAASIIMLRGFELGLSPMVAVNSLYVVNGKVGVEADMLLAAIRNEMPQAEIEIVESTNKSCKISAKRPNEKKPTIHEYTIDEAQAAGLLHKDNWKKHPTDMLFARCVSRMKRRQFNEVMKGLSHTREELEDIRDVTPQTETSPLPTQTETTPQPTSIRKVKNYATGEEVEIKPQTTEKSEEDKVDSKPTEPQGQAAAPTLDRKKIGEEIAALAKEMGHTQESLASTIQNWKNKPMAKLTTEEMNEFLQSMKKNYQEMNDRLGIGGGDGK